MSFYNRNTKSHTAITIHIHLIFERMSEYSCVISFQFVIRLKMRCQIRKCNPYTFEHDYFILSAYQVFFQYNVVINYCIDS